jgi:hypothetical protein
MCLAAALCLHIHDASSISRFSIKMHHHYKLRHNARPSLYYVSTFGGLFEPSTSASKTYMRAPAAITMEPQPNKEQLKECSTLAIGLSLLLKMFSTQAQASRHHGRQAYTKLLSTLLRSNKSSLRHWSCKLGSLAPLSLLNMSCFSHGLCPYCLGMRIEQSTRNRNTFMHFAPADSA